MQDSELARRYAKALLEAMSAHGTDAKNFLADAARLENSLKQEAGLAQFLADPSGDGARKTAELKAWLAKQSVQNQPLWYNFFHLLLEKKRVNLLPAIWAEARQ